MPKDKKRAFTKEQIRSNLFRTVLNDSREELRKMEGIYRGKPQDPSKKQFTKEYAAKAIPELRETIMKTSILNDLFYVPPASDNNTRPSPY